MTAKHTSGPWAVTSIGFLTNDGQSAVMGVNAEGEPVRIALVDMQRQDVKRVQEWKAEDAERDANMRLIAAAPELLEALEAAIECGMVPVSSAKDGGAVAYARQVVVADQIRAAIAKATAA